MECQNKNKRIKCYRTILYKNEERKTDKWAFLRGREDVVWLLEENDEMCKRIAQMENDLALYRSMLAGR